MIDEKGGEVGEGGHVEELEEGPAPAIGFASDDGEGAYALHGEGEENDEAKGGEGRERPVCRVAVYDGHSADKEFSGGEGGDEADADFPVVAEGFDDSFDGFAHLAYVAIFERGGLERGRLWVGA